MVSDPSVTTGRPLHLPDPYPLKSGETVSIGSPTFQSRVPRVRPRRDSGVTTRSTVPVLPSGRWWWGRWPVGDE